MTTCCDLGTGAPGADSRKVPVADDYANDAQHDDYMRDREDRNSTNSVVEFFVLGGIGVLVVGGAIYGGAVWFDSKFGTNLAGALSDWFASATAPTPPAP